MNEPEVNHVHTEESWDSYRIGGPSNTAYPVKEVAVHFENGKFEALHIKSGTGNHVVFTDLDEIKQILTALHAAIAAIAKRPQKETPDGTQE